MLALLLALLLAQTNPKCTAVMSNDGPNGFLWKSSSDSDGNLAILMPKEFQKGFVKVTVLRTWAYKGGRLVWRKRPVVEECRRQGFGNGDRQHWRCAYPGAFYDGHVVAFDGEQTCEWRVPCPSMRQD